MWKMETWSKVLVIESILIFCMWDIMIGLNLKVSADNEKNGSNFIKLQLPKINLSSQHYNS